MRRLVVVALLLAGCKDVPYAYPCTVDTQCVVDGQSGGLCEATGYCSFPDATCTAAPNRRYRAASDVLDGQCVPPIVVSNNSLCATFTGLACQSFETMPISDGWSDHETNGGFTQDTIHVVRGSRAGHFARMQAPATGSTFAELQWTGLPTDSDVLAARAFFFFPTVPPDDDTRFVTFQMDTMPYTAVNIRYTKDGLTSASPAGEPLSATPFPTARWACFEMVLQRGGTTGQLSVYLDGNELMDLRQSFQPSSFPKFREAIFGTLTNSPGRTLAAFDFWVDEVALDTQRIGCDR
jgi:hypothetical protein